MLYKHVIHTAWSSVVDSTQQIFEVMSLAALTEQAFVNWLNTGLRSPVAIGRYPVRYESPHSVDNPVKLSSWS